IEITQPAALTASTSSTTNVDCFGNSTGAIDISVSGGTAPYTYMWSNSADTEDISDIAAGTYNVTITDANSCTFDINDIEITQPAALTASTSSTTNVDCFGNSTGAIDISVSGGTAPYTYMWSNSADTEDISGITAGTYNVTITDANSCTFDINDIEITQPAALTASTSSTTNVDCFGNSTGAIDISVSGGTAPYTYMWSNSADTEDIS
ncbi:SprB repeat-containing protein, partial [Aestuariibaculum lutulentum]